MNYCALDDAFQEIGGAPSPGCLTDYATKMARKEERKKARRCKGPPAEYLNIESRDPDRQHLAKAPEIPAMNPATGLREHVPVTAPQGSLEPFSNESDDSTDKMMSVQHSTVSKKKYFGASPDDDFADYVPDQGDYRLQPDFLPAFEHAGVARAGSTAALPNPSVNMYWKPLTTSGAQTSFIEKLPPPGGKYYQAPRGEISMDEVMKKMDKIFARLDDMNTSTPEQVTSELLMFISSGIFVLFLMDLLVKKGGRLRF
jgi:hypothetical protein